MQQYRRQLAGLAVVALCLGCTRCGSPGAKPDGRPPITVASRAVARLPSDDWRQLLVGRWIVTFTVDSVAVPVRDAPVAWRATGGRFVSGQLIVEDSLVQGFPASGLRRSALPDFRAVLDRALSCAEPDVGLLAVRRLDGGRLSLDFTPGANDCGVRATVTGDQDSMTGSWYEPSIGMGAAVGRIRLVRERH